MDHEGKSISVSGVEVKFKEVDIGSVVLDF